MIKIVHSRSRDLCRYKGLGGEVENKSSFVKKLYDYNSMSRILKYRVKERVWMLR